MVGTAKFKDLAQVDIIGGGDHGGRKFRMTMNVNFWFPDMKTISYLTQIAITSVYFKCNVLGLLNMMINMKRARVIHIYLWRAQLKHFISWGYHGGR
jgi:hypothetical protein